MVVVIIEVLSALFIHIEAFPGIFQESSNRASDICI